MPHLGWDHADTVYFYEAFNSHHTRYREANRELTSRADLQRGFRILDIAAGSGLTTQAVLDCLGDEATVVCFEPAEAMRRAGQRRLQTPAVEWSAAWPEGCFDRVLCGAAAWLMAPLEEFFGRARRSTKNGGCFCFNIPSLYLREPDPPGGGSDPLLLELPAMLAEGRAPSAASQPPLPEADEIDELLRMAGFSPQRWRHRQRFTQKDYREWLKIPVLTNGLLNGLDANERARLIDASYAQADSLSWRWETWTGWTAWVR